jgi:hypothetical protein
MRFSLILLLSATIVSCVSLAPREVRQISYPISTRLLKANTHVKINEWAAKNLGDSNSAIKMNDKDTGKLIIHANVKCAEANPASAFLGNPVALWFNLTVTSQDNAVDFLFEDVIVEGGWEPSSTQQMSKLSTACLEPIVRQLELTLK